MKKIFESDYNGWSIEGADRIYVYELENEDEFWEFESMSHKQKCRYFDVFDESGYDIMPGAKYYTYEFINTGKHIIMCETAAYNI